MTLTEIKVLRDKYYNALVALDPSKLSYSLNGETVNHDAHRSNLQEMFLFYDRLYNAKQNAGKGHRLNIKAV